MIINEIKPINGSNIQIGAVPSGLDSLVVAEIAAEHAEKPVIFVTRDDSQMVSASEVLTFFALDLHQYRFPAWDCLPYDRVSPRADILGERVDCLAGLARETGEKAAILLTTVNAFLQRVPEPAHFANNAMAVSLGETLDIDNLLGFLNSNGFNRTGTVREPGEYAIRGGIIDIYPADREKPVRIDLFGDDIEDIREFDAISQTSAEKLDRFSLNPVSELVLDDDTIARFRSGYRELFGDVASDPLYEAVTAGQKIAGMEHWLPLFLPKMALLSDFLPDAPIIFQDQAMEAIAARRETIADFYDARLSWLNNGGKKSTDNGQTPYRPLPPDRFYVPELELEKTLSVRPVIQLSPFVRPDFPGKTQLDAGGRKMIKFNDPVARSAGEGENHFNQAINSVEDLIRKGGTVAIAAYSAGSRERLAGLFREHGLTRQFMAENWAETLNGPKGHAAFVTLGIEEGFSVGDLHLITEQDILGDRLIRPGNRRRRNDAFLADISEISAGDLVVHVEHGLGRYEGLETIEAAGAPHDCLKVIYAGDDRLFVPVENIELLSRFGSGDAVATLDRLGSAAWQARKSKLKERLREIAEELIKTAAARALKPGRRLTASDIAYAEFCARFPFHETDDQSRAIADTLSDLNSGRPMDRLICGDVGFGKTEVALRAAFQTVMAGGQVAVIAPTTLLTRQHFKSFTERFTSYPVEIKLLSRLVSAKEAAETREMMANGGVDIVIGTHALLGKSVSFKDLALLVIDEEQHFGVTHKERLKQLRADVHVLTLSATPIPRTLQMALSGVKDMSIIATPPVDRLAVRTFVLPTDPVILREAILREKFRGGQVFYVCPRISDLDSVAAQVREMVPDIRIAVAHGQMPVSELEEVMGDFYDGRTEMLISTQIVESGLDIPNANTLIIHRADMFGLAQLYQLRGRIGRSKVRAYCYLTLPPTGAPGPVALKRLEVMQSLDSLGAGFTLASHDLDIRGAGNLLGDEQSGHIREVGVELYQQMLEEAVAEARGGDEAQESADWTPTISLGTSVFIPESYVADLNARLSLYRRASSITDPLELDSFAAEMMDRFGPLPDEVENFLQIIAIKKFCRRAGIEKLEAGPKGALLKFHEDKFANPERLIGYIQSQPQAIRLRPDHQLVVRRDWNNAETRLRGARKLAGELAELAA